MKAEEDKTLLRIPNTSTLAAPEISCEGKSSHSYTCQGLGFRCHLCQIFNLPLRTCIFSSKFNFFLKNAFTDPKKRYHNNTYRFLLADQINRVSSIGFSREEGVSSLNTQQSLCKRSIPSLRREFLNMLLM